jgi:hypothetical protein
VRRVVLTNFSLITNPRFDFFYHMTLSSQPTTPLVRK